MKIPAASLALLLSLPAFAKPVAVASASASSEFPGDVDVNYTAKNAADGKVATCWTEGDQASSGMGQWLEYTFAAETTLTHFQIWNGGWASYDLWGRQNRIRDVELTFSDGSKQKFTLSDDFSAQTVTLSPAVKTTSVKMTIKSVYNGTTFTDTPISEVVFYDNSHSDQVEVSGWGTSSVYPADADGNYEAANLTDGIKDTMWCEGSQEGDGVGEWIEANFGGTYTVRSVKMINGNGGDATFWKKGNRASKATLTFSNGTSQTVVVKNFFLPQTIPITPVETSSVRITFDEVSKGDEFNDLCVSELSFHQ